MTEEDEGWLRLDARKLLLDPIRTLGQLLIPAIAVLLGIGSSDNPLLSLFLAPVILLGILVLGALPWLTTTYRITPAQFQLRKGWLNRTTSTAPLDRVRSVDLEASLLHRVLGMRKVQVGTGRDEERITLDALSNQRAEELRTLLLARRQAAQQQVPHEQHPSAPPAPWAGPTGVERPQGAEGPAEGPGGPSGPVYPGWEHAGPTAGPPAAPPPPPEQELARIDWTWLRFAPFGLGRLVVVAGALGVLWQFLDDIPVVDEQDVTSAWEWLTSFALALVVAVLAVVVVVGWLVISVLGYVVQWWGLRLTRSQGSLHLTSGLLTTRSISVEEQRVRGVELREPVLLSVVNGAELSTLATGVGAGGQTRILPPSPVPVATSVGSEVLGTPEPLGATLRQHGPAARRRAHIGRQLDTLLLLAASLVLTFTDWVGFLSWVPTWLPWALTAVLAVVSGWAAERAYAHLGHAATTDHLVAGHDRIARVRTALETDGIIGWVMTQNPFQRRAGLVTLVATTAAGGEKVEITDVPQEWAVALADACTPGVLSPFLAEPAG